jgi:hypothetical protein
MRKAKGGKMVVEQNYYEKNINLQILKRRKFKE